MRNLNHCPIPPGVFCLFFPMHLLFCLFCFSVSGHCAVKDPRRQDQSMMWCALAWQVLERPACSHGSVVRAATASYQQQVCAHNICYKLWREPFLGKNVRTWIEAHTAHSYTRHLSLTCALSCFKNILSAGLELQIDNAIQVLQLLDRGMHVFSMSS